MTKPSIVTNFVMYKGNAYHRALYCALGKRYAAERGDVDSAHEHLVAGDGRLLHIHWEEHTLRSARTQREAKALVDRACGQIEAYGRAGGRVIWTVHNLMPHELEHHSVFLTFRQRLGQLAHRIIVHSPEAVGVLEEQGVRAPLKTRFVPHPSYIGIYPQDKEFPTMIPAAGAEKVILVFGLIRRYKAIHRLISSFTDDFARKFHLRLEIVGKGIPGDVYASELAELAANRTHVTIREEHVPDEDIAGLFSRASCVVLPYERLLSSGVAMLALTYSVPVVGPRIRSLEESLPSEAHRFLFTPENDTDMMRAVAEASSLSPEEAASIRRKMWERAQHLHPRRISLQLGEIYDNVRLTEVCP